MSIKFRAFLLAIFSVLVSQIVMTSIPTEVSAETTTTNWSWTNESPVVFSSDKVNSAGAGWCSGYYQSKEIAGEASPQKTCMFNGQKIRFGLYFTGQEFIPTVGFSYDSKMYKVNGICREYGSCLYLPGTDTLVAKQYMNGFVRSLAIYKNFTDRLTKVLSVTSPNFEYNFDYSNQDYIVKADETILPVGGYGASENGKWLAIEFRQGGIGLLNIETLQMKRISTIYYQYDFGHDPISEFSVSNDGLYVVVMGLNSGFTLINSDPECGDEPTMARIGPMLPIEKPCMISPIVYNDIIPNFGMGSKPRFNDDGGEMSFVATSYTDGLREVALRASGYGGQKLDYLALGDSYSSGEGETFDSFYMDGTNDKFEKCHLSTWSYPFIISKLTGFNQNNMKSVACSGATTVDVVGNGELYLGQGNRLGSDYMNLVTFDRELAQSQALATFLPGRIHQEDFVKKYQPKSITIGIGGNDAGFMEKLQACIGPDTCVWAGTVEGREKSATEIKNQFSTLVQTYQKIHLLSPGSKIYAIGYPQIIDPTGQCSSFTNFLFDDAEKQFIVEGISYLNKVIAAAAKTAGIKYVDIEGSFGDKAICGKQSPSAMNTVRFGDDFSPTDKVNWFKAIGQESFHPNPSGHYLTGVSIFNSIGNVSTFTNCSNGAIICPVYNVLAPEPSVYWIPNGYGVGPRQQIASLISGKDSSLKHIELIDYSLAPNSAVRIEVASTPQLLGQFTASITGSLSVNINLPVDLPDGYHTIHLYGTTYSGEEIDLYQVIGVGLPVDDGIVTPPVIEDIIVPVIETIITNKLDTPTDNLNNEIIVSVVPVKIQSKIVETTQPELETEFSLTSDIFSAGGMKNRSYFSLVLQDKPEVKGASVVVDKKKSGKDAEIQKKNNYGYLNWLFVIILVIIFLINLLLKRNKKH